MKCSFFEKYIDVIRQIKAQLIILHSCPEALLRIKKVTRTETYTGSLYDTWGVLKIFFKTFQLGNFEKSTNLCFPYAKLGAKMEENSHF